MRNSQVRKQWVNREHVEPMTSEELKLTWKWAQMTLYKAWKQERLLDMGLLSEDLDLLDSLDTLETLSFPKLPDGGITLQHVELGWHVLQWNMHQQFMDTKALAWVSAGWTNPLYLAHGRGEKAHGGA